MEYLKKCLKNGWFIAAMISWIGMVLVYVFGLFGIQFDYGPIKEILTVLAGILSGVGIITSPDSKGVFPSESEVK